MFKAEETIFYKIESTIKAYRKLAQSTIRKIDPNLTLDQSMLLKKLMENPNVTQRELASLIFKDVASVTRMIELLVKNGFLLREPNPSNRRQNLLTPTKKAMLLMNKITKIVKMNRAKALKKIDQKDLEHCRSTLDTILSNIEN